MRALCFFLSLVAVLAGWPAAAGAQTAEKIFVNGKIVTVDDRFTIAQALAVRGQRIMAVGENGEIEKLRGPATEVIDLNGRTVIPGLIDNHSHWIRAAEHNELRFDGVTSRQQAVKMLAERVRGTAPGEWIVVLGGWSEEQFTDERAVFRATSSTPLRRLIRSCCRRSITTPISIVPRSSPPGSTQKRPTRRAARSRRMRAASRRASFAAPAASLSLPPRFR